MIKDEYYVDKKGNEMYYKYTDKNGIQLFADDFIKWDNGKVDKLYATMDGELGTDATNPTWIESGRAVPCEYGVYPLCESETEQIVKY